MKAQKKPKRNKYPSIFKEAKKILDQRERKGIKTYGTTLQPFNGRNAIQDALEEVADLFVYMTQLLIEQNEKAKR